MGSIALVVSLCVATVVAGVGATVALAADDAEERDRFVRGEPDLDVSAPANTVTPGETQDVEVVVTNDGEIRLGTVADRDAVTMARDVRLTAEADAGDPIAVESDTVALGSVTERQPATATLQVTVPEDASAGEYEVPVELEYSYTDQLSDRGGVTSERRTTKTRTLTLEVDDDARFVVRNVSTTAPVGDAGTVSLTLENVGEGVATDATVVTESKSGAIAFGESPRDEAYVGAIDPGETATVTHDVAVRDGASVRPYALESTVSWNDADGVRSLEEGIVAGVTPLPEQSFAATAVDATLRVGADGAIVGTVENRGPHPVGDVTVSIPESRNVYPTEPTVAVGSLGVDETAEVRFPVEVGDEAEPIAHRFDLEVAYTNHEGDRRVSSDPALSVEVAERRDEFRVEPVTSTVAAGSEGTIDLAVTNNGDDPVENVHVKVFTDDPLSSDDDEAFVPRLAPNETATLPFGLAVESSATPKTYQVSTDVRYDDVDGETKLSDTYYAPIEVAPADSRSLGALPLASLGALSVGTVGVLWWRRTDGDEP